MDAATDIQPASAPVNPNLQAPQPVAPLTNPPAPASPIVPATTPSIVANAPVTTTQLPQNPKQTFMQGMKETIAPKYTTDADGNVISAAPATRRSVHGVLGSLLAGALEGVVSGMAAQRRPGENGYSAGARADQRDADDRDADARKVAETNFKNKQAVLKAQVDNQTNTAAQLELASRTASEDASTKLKMEQTHKLDEDQQKQMHAATEAQLKMQTDQTSWLHSEGVDPIDVIPVADSDAMKRATAHIQSNVAGRSFVMTATGPDGKPSAFFYRTSDLERPITQQITMPIIGINPPVGKDGQPDLSAPMVFTPDGHTTLAQAVQAAQKATQDYQAWEKSVVTNARTRALTTKDNQPKAPKAPKESDAHKLANEQTNHYATARQTALTTLNKVNADSASTPEDKKQAQTVFNLADQQYEKSKAPYYATGPNAPKSPATAPAKPKVVPPPAGQVSVSAPDGSVHIFPNQAAADTFKKIARIK